MNSAAVSASVDTHKFFHVGEQPSSLSSWHAGRVHHRYRMLNPASSIVERLLVPQCPTAFKKYLGSSNLISKFNLLILLAHWGSKDLVPSLICTGILGSTCRPGSMSTSSCCRPPV